MNASGTELEIRHKELAEQLITKLEETLVEELAEMLGDSTEMSLLVEQVVTKLEETPGDMSEPVGYLAQTLAKELGGCLEHALDEGMTGLQGLATELAEEIVEELAVGGTP